MKDIRKQFPIYEKHPDLVYLDSAATALKPQIVLGKMMEYYTEYSANIHRGMYALSGRATQEYEKVREKVKGFIGAKDEGEIIFTSGTTAGINMIARAWGEQNLFPGDEIVVSEMEHHSNLVPWQMLAKRKMAKLKYFSIDSRFRIQDSGLEQAISKKTKILAITQVSNVLGVINPAKEIIKKAREINPKIAVLVDGAQAVAHIPVDVQDLGCDFYVFSAHKMYGPTGVGVLYVKKERQKEMEPVTYGGGMIEEVGKESASWAEGVERYEAGTPAIGEVIGMGAAIDFVKGIDFEIIAKHEREITKYAFDKLNGIEGLKIYSDNTGVGVISFSIDGVHPHDVAEVLGRQKVCVRSGLHCAQPLHILLGCEYGTTRVSLGIYNTKQDIDCLVEGVKEVERIFKKSKS